MSFGLALSGGGAKGAAHVGVLLALFEHRLYPSSIAGISSGAIVAGLLAYGIKPIQLKKMVLTLSGINIIDPNYKKILLSAANLLRQRNIELSGFIKGDRLEGYIRKLIGNTMISDIKMRLVIPAVDLNSGKTIAYTNDILKPSCIDGVEWRDNIKLSTAIRASSSIPAIFEPTFVDDLCLVDGGVTDILPVDLLIACGEKNIVSVDISSNYKMPDNYNIFEIATHSFFIMRNLLCKTDIGREKVLIKPNIKDNAGVFSFSHMPAYMQAGYIATKKLIPQIMQIV